MPYIISAGTHVYIGGSEAPGIQSVNVSFSPQIQRLYAMGSASVYDRNTINQKSINFTMYGQGSSPTYQFGQSPADGCDPAAAVVIEVRTNPCGDEDEIDIVETWFITSYSYSKEAQAWGIESYSFVTAPEVIGGGAIPTMIAGIPEGQSTINGGADTGIRYINPAGGEQLEGELDGYTLEVTAGSPGIGKAFNMTFGEVSSVGGGTGKLDGSEGNGSVNFPYSTIYLGT